MAGLQHLEFFLLRYAGDVTKGENINLGVVAIAPEGEEAGGFVDARFIRDWRRLNCFDPLSDIEELQAIEREIRRDLQDPQRRGDLLKRLNDSWSNLLSFEGLQGCLTESPALEIERLSAIYLETPKPAIERQRTGRQQILAVMRNELQNAGVLTLMLKNISVAEFTRPGDPLRLDFGYSSGRDLKLLHAVSLKQALDTGMMLAARFPQIAKGAQTKKGMTAWLTAVVEDELDRSRAEIGFALDTMRESGIVVAPVAEMPEIAEGIGLELSAGS